MNINKQKMDEEINRLNKEEEFKMDEDEKKEAINFGFNQFWNTKSMEENIQYKFRIISDKIIIREIEDNFKGKPTPRMVISIEELETGSIYDLVAYKEKNKDGNYSSLTLAMRKLYALTGGNLKDKMIALLKNTYKHEKYGDTSSYRINILEP